MGEGSDGSGRGPVSREAAEGDRQGPIPPSLLDGAGNVNADNRRGLRRTQSSVNKINYYISIECKCRLR
jgi:hypothetical protein